MDLRVLMKRSRLIRFLKGVTFFAGNILISRFTPSGGVKGGDYALYGYFLEKRL